jgi:hypothetical protein
MTGSSGNGLKWFHRRLNLSGHSGSWDWLLASRLFKLLARNVMPIVKIRLEKQHAFAPEEIKKIVQAFEAALASLRLRNRQDAMAMMIAEVVFEAAKQGQTDPARLRDIAVEKFSTLKKH